MHSTILLTANNRWDGAAKKEGCLVEEAQDLRDLVYSMRVSYKIISREQRRMCAGMCFLLWQCQSGISPVMYSKATLEVATSWGYANTSPRNRR